jgi:hypothetical protein
MDMINRFFIFVILFIDFPLFSFHTINLPWTHLACSYFSHWIILTNLVDFKNSNTHLCLSTFESSRFILNQQLLSQTVHMQWVFAIVLTFPQ